MRKNSWLTLVSVALLLALLMTSTACAKPAEATGEDLMDGVQGEEVTVPKDYVEEHQEALLNFSINFFREAHKEEGGNVLLSPVSLMSALGMTGNGALENTLKEMEAVFGLSMEELQNLLYLYNTSLPKEDGMAVHMANSIWFKEGGSISVQPEFLTKNATYYDAGIYQAPFDDTTVTAINNWVKEKTKDRIEEILDEIPEDALMYLINALSFDGQWMKKYSENQVGEGVFVNAQGVEENVKMMRSEESLYVEDEEVYGFMKPYEGGEFLFMALLPKAEESLEDLLSRYTGSALKALLDNKQVATVYTAMPKFTTEFEMEASDAFKALGMKDAFESDRANLKALGTSPIGNLYIGRILHKTLMEVNEQGTKAGAVTAVEVVAESAAMDPKTVELNRPFLYMIVDTKSHLPLFLGAMESIEE